jgi:allantoate deiminase
MAWRMNFWWSPESSFMVAPALFQGIVSQGCLRCNNGFWAMGDLMGRLAALAAVSDGPRLTRLFLSPAHQRATELVAGWMREAGLQAHVDAIGNVVGWNGVTGPRLILGSHIDTVRDAGWFDGNFGVLAAIAAVEQAGALPFGVEVIAFGDEEGVRFPTTLSGSRAVAGIFDSAAFADVDADLVSMDEALREFGGDPDGVAALARDPAQVLGYVELHIEQGPVLEAAGLAAGVVTAIAGASRYAVSVTGAAGHAGTVPMAMRHDALTAAAEMILTIEAVARERAAVVATVGALSVTPGAPNSIPGAVRFSIDLRAPADADRLAAAEDIRAGLDRIAVSRRVDYELMQVHEAPATCCAPWLQAQLMRAVAARTGREFALPSGAGHDAMAMAALCPVGMVFVRCRGGVSHTPEEFLSAEDALVGVEILADFLRGFARTGSVG